MINHNQKEKLKANWGDKADSMACLAEVRVFDPLSPWECYIYAMNPDDENEIKCIIKGFFVSVEENWQMSEIENLYNTNGEGVKVDEEYRPRRAAELFKLLSEGKR